MTVSAVSQSVAHRSAAAAASTGFLMGASHLGARPRVRREPAEASSDRQVGLTVAAVIAGLATVSWCLWIVLAFFAA